jgi:hypothetical protein
MRNKYKTSYIRHRQKCNTQAFRNGWRQVVGLAGNAKDLETFISRLVLTLVDTTPTRPVNRFRHSCSLENHHSPTCIWQQPHNPGQVCS